MKLAKILLAASIGLALTFTLSCSSDDGGEGNSQSYSYCLKSETCLSGPFTLNDCNSLGGLPSNSCPHGGVEPSIRCSALIYNTETHYCLNGTIKEYGFVTDDGGQTYKSVVIGKQTRMAENLNYDASGSKCYDNNPANCTTYGRLYDWNTALTVCPSGWHLQSDEELDKYLEMRDMYDIKGLDRMSTGGFFDSDRFFSGGCWWLSSEDGSLNAYGNGVSELSINCADWLNYGCWGNDCKSILFSVRCVQD
jgi:hypothetical protein